MCRTMKYAYVYNDRYICLLWWTIQVKLVVVCKMHASVWHKTTWSERESRNCNCHLSLVMFLFKLDQFSKKTKRSHKHRYKFVSFKIFSTCGQKNLSMHPAFDKFVGIRRRLKRQYWVVLRLNHKALIVQRIFHAKTVYGTGQVDLCF